ncbi:uncharacterized protein LOC105906211 isoform X2 [Clupea harengus]|uniref:Uncharacterized protein LOC105906211 isoform X2 n=1 Tax=Clupea harengus TaxID=7950 RepID=A0A6P8ED78_CLUHA|nr:uncharacterized protein LOC105906211 isoform X2 [Clupea harengus]
MSAVSGHGIKLPGLPVTRRAIPKPTCTLANSMLEGNAAPSGIPGAYKRFSLGMKAALRSAASATPTQQPAPAAEKRLSLAPACSARLRKKTNEGAIPSLSKDTAASSVRPSQASASLKRPVPEPKGGPAKRSKGEPVSNIRSGLLRKRGASSVTAPSLDSEDTYLCECGRKTACKKCQHLLQENQKLRRELSTLKSHK